MTRTITLWQGDVNTVLELGPIIPGVAPCCRSCQNEWDKSEEDLEDEPPEDEGSFSWSTCECCGSTSGGNRYAAHQHLSGEKGGLSGGFDHLSICEDCLCYLANGDLPKAVD